MYYVLSHALCFPFHGLLLADSSYFLFWFFFCPPYWCNHRHYTARMLKKLGAVLALFGISPLVLSQQLRAYRVFEELAFLDVANSFAPAVPH